MEKESPQACQRSVGVQLKDVSCWVIEEEDPVEGREQSVPPDQIVSNF